MIKNVLIVIIPSILIIFIFYKYVNFKLEKKLQIINEKEKNSENKKDERNFEIEFKDKFKIIKEHVEKNEEKYKPKNNNFSKNNLNYNYLNYPYFNKKEKNYYVKGREFEIKVKKYYENLGYQVFDNSKFYGKKDEGIDLIAVNISKNEMLFIQCKNWKKRKINHNHIKQFISDYILYLKKHKNEINKYKNRKFILAIPDKILTKSGYAKIKENNDIMDFIII
ncbi:restriction endonuclease [Caminibacter sp.]